MPTVSAGSGGLTTFLSKERTCLLFTGEVGGRKSDFRAVSDRCRLRLVLFDLFNIYNLD